VRQGSLSGVAVSKQRTAMDAKAAGGSATEYLSDALKEFPPVQHAFAYGSGVFHQPGLYKSRSGARPMIDFIFAVDNPQQWHTENIQRNRTHYSFLASFGGSAVSACANRIGVGVHFNTLVPWREQVMIKYGVIAVDRLEQDLVSWDSLYIGGRMHKPVLCLLEDPRVAAAAEKNIECALCASLLLLPREFTTQVYPMAATYGTCAFHHNSPPKFRSIHNPRMPVREHTPDIIGWEDAGAHAHHLLPVLRRGHPHGSCRGQQKGFNDRGG